MSKVISHFRQLSPQPLGEHVKLTFNEAYPALKKEVQLVPSAHGVIYQAQAYDAAAEHGRLFYCEGSELRIVCYSNEDDPEGHKLQGKRYEFLWVGDKGQSEPREIAEAIGLVISLTVQGSPTPPL